MPERWLRLHAYLGGTGIASDPKGLLFRTKSTGGGDGSRCAGARPLGISSLAYTVYARAVRRRLRAFPVLGGVHHLGFLHPTKPGAGRSCATRLAETPLYEATAVKSDSVPVRLLASPAISPRYADPELGLFTSAGRSRSTLYPVGSRRACTRIPHRGHQGPGGWDPSFVTACLSPRGRWSRIHPGSVSPTAQVGSRCLTL